MKLILRNFLSILKSYKQSSIFNILGLAFAFVACYLIFIQANYDFNFGKDHKGYQNIYRVNLLFGDMNAALASPSIKLALDKSPSVAASALLGNWASLSGAYALIGGEKTIINHDIQPVDSCLYSVIEFDMVIGVFADIQSPNTALVPLSLAVEVFGSAENAIQQKLYKKQGDEQYLEIAGIYNDFSDLSVLPNNIFINMSVDYSKPFNGFNEQLYFKAVKGANVSELEDALTQKIRSDFGNSFGDASLGIYFTPFSEVYFQRDIMFVFHATGNKAVTLTLILVAILIMIIAIINFVNFSIAIAPRRIKTINIYRVLGHSLNGLRVMIVLEAIFLALLSFLVAIGITFVISTTTFVNIFATSILLTDNLGSLLIMSGFVVVIGFMAGIYPALHITNFAPAMVLNGGKSLPKSAMPIRQMLISFQYIISISMIIISVFINMQNNMLLNRDYGYDSENMLTVKVGENRGKITDDLLRDYSFIKDVTFSDQNIISGNSYSVWSLENKNPMETKFETFGAYYNYPQFMGFEITEGEDFTESDLSSDIHYMLFNETARDKYDLKLGQKIESGNNGIIKGFFKDVNHGSLHNPVSPFALSLNKYRSVMMSVKYIGDQNIVGAINAVRKVIADNNNGAIADITTSDQARYHTYKKDININTIISWSALLAIIISVIGVVGLISLESQHRIREIAIRKVNGATTMDILSMFNMKFIKIIMICYAIAIPISWYVVNEWLQGFEYKVIMHPWVFIVAGLMITIMTVFLVTAQSYKAAITQPVQAMKY